MTAGESLASQHQGIWVGGSDGNQEQSLPTAFPLPHWVDEQGRGASASGQGCIHMYVTMAVCGARNLGLLAVDAHTGNTKAWRLQQEVWEG